MRTGRDFSRVTRAADATFYAPLKWKTPRLIFVCSLGDFFFDGGGSGEDGGVGAGYLKGLTAE